LSQGESGAAGSGGMAPPSLAVFAAIFSPDFLPLVTLPPSPIHGLYTNLGQVAKYQRLYLEA